MDFGSRFLSANWSENGRLLPIFLLKHLHIHLVEGYYVAGSIIPAKNSWDVICLPDNKGQHKEFILSRRLVRAEKWAALLLERAGKYSQKKGSAALADPF